MNIHLVTSYSDHRIRKFKDIVLESLDHGVSTVQFSYKTEYDKNLFSLAEWVRKITSEYNSNMIVNNRVDVALAVDADGCHIGQNDIQYRFAKKLLQNKIIGVTLNNVSDIEKYQDATYYGIGPIFKSNTRSNLTPIGIDSLTNFRKNTDKEIVAIGGITSSNVQSVYQAGADSIAVIGEIYNSNNIKQTINQLRKDYHV